MKATASVVSRSWRYARHIRRSLALILLAVCLAIPMQGCDDTKNPTDDDPAAEGSALLPESELTSGCYNWPAEPWSPTNNTGGLRTPVAEGEPAIDFTLKDLAGNAQTLSVLLESKPVLMVFGAWT